MEGMEVVLVIANVVKFIQFSAKRGEGEREREREREHI